MRANWGDCCFYFVFFSRTRWLFSNFFLWSSKWSDIFRNCFHLWTESWRWFRNCGNRSFTNWRSSRANWTWSRFWLSLILWNWNISFYLKISCYCWSHSKLRVIWSDLTVSRHWSIEWSSRWSPRSRHWASISIFIWILSAWVRGVAFHWESWRNTHEHSWSLRWLVIFLFVCWSGCLHQSTFCPRWRSSNWRSLSSPNCLGTPFGKIRPRSFFSTASGFSRYWWESSISWN
jgi:hypothetical protein